MFYTREKTTRNAQSLMTSERFLLWKLFLIYGCLANHLFLALLSCSFLAVLRHWNEQYLIRYMSRHATWMGLLHCLHFMTVCMSPHSLEQNRLSLYLLLKIVLQDLHVWVYWVYTWGFCRHDTLQYFWFPCLWTKTLPQEAHLSASNFRVDTFLPPPKGHCPRFAYDTSPSRL